MEKKPQLVMHWKKSAEEFTANIPSDVKVETFSQLENALDTWLDLVQYGLTGTKQGPVCYKSLMSDREWYNEDSCYFLVIDGRAAATITVICNKDKKQGYVHMVACHPDFRGRGLGNVLNEVAVSALYREGMETAYLTTDDFRIPAIKTYLKSGFYADLSSDDFKDRWNKIFEIIEK
jgi:mycothiol synthase